MEVRIKFHASQKKRHPNWKRPRIRGDRPFLTRLPLNLSLSIAKELSRTALEQGGGVPFLEAWRLADQSSDLTLTSSEFSFERDPSVWNTGKKVMATDTRAPHNKH